MIFFMKLHKTLTFGHRLPQVEHKETMQDYS